MDTHITMFLLDKFEEGGHVRPPKMVDGLQACKHAATLQPLEVIFTNILEENNKSIIFGFQSLSFDKQHSKITRKYRVGNLKV